jgi:hypothetical protein
MVNIEAALDASRAPSPGARASFDLNAAPRASLLSVPARLVDPGGYNMDFLVGIVRGASSDGLLLLDYLDTRESHRSLDPDGGVEWDVRLFVCNPASGQLFRLPAPDMGVLRGRSTAFGLLTQSSQGSRGPPDRYVVAQLSCSTCGSHSVVRRFLSETGQWDERPLVIAAGPFTTQDERRMLIDHEVLAFQDRLWWVDVTWGVCSIDPFSDRPERRFVELPDYCALPDHVDGLSVTPILSRYRRVGVSEGKLRLVILVPSKTEKSSFLIASSSLDVESCSWTLDHTIKITQTAAGDASKPLEHRRPWIAAIDPLKANVVYVQYGGAVIALDMAKGVQIGRSPLQMMCNPSLFLPCVLPPWLASSYIPGIYI